MATTAAVARDVDAVEEQLDRSAKRSRASEFVHQFVWADCHRNVSRSCRAPESSALGGNACCSFHFVRRGGHGDRSLVALSKTLRCDYHLKNIKKNSSSRASSVSMHGMGGLTSYLSFAQKPKIFL